MGMAILQNLQKFRVRVGKSYITHRSSRYGYGNLTELTQVPGTVFGTGVQNLLKFRVRV